MPCRKAGKHELFRYTLLTRKGKTCESVGRKATGLNPERGMAAGLPGGRGYSHVTAT
jgi:hypothetical protein